MNWIIWVGIGLGLWILWMIFQQIEKIINKKINKEYKK